MTQISFRDIELLSAYLDEQLTPGERTRLESRLAHDPQLASALQALTQSRATLRKLPQRRVPRNFTLTPQMAGVKPPLPRSYPFFRLASALAALIFFFASAINFAAPRVAMLAAAPMAYGGYGGGGGDASDRTLEQSAVPTETVQKAVPSAPGTPTPAPTFMPFAVMATPTPEATATETPLPAPIADNRMQPDASNASIPVVWLWGSVIVAILSGGIAFFLRWRADRQFDKNKRGK